MCDYPVGASASSLRQFYALHSNIRSRDLQTIQVTWHGAPVNVFLADHDAQCAGDSLLYPPDPSFSPLYSALCVGELYVDYSTGPPYPLGSASRSN